MMTQRILLLGLGLILLAGCASADPAYNYYGRHDCHYYNNCDNGGYFK